MNRPRHDSARTVDSFYVLAGMGLATRRRTHRRPRLSPVRTISISRLRPIALGPALAGQKGCASASPLGLAAAIAGRFRLGIEVGICFAPGLTSGGGGLALLIA